MYNFILETFQTMPNHGPIQLDNHYEFQPSPVANYRKFGHLEAKFYHSLSHRLLSYRLLSYRLLSYHSFTSLIFQSFYSLVFPYQYYNIVNPYKPKNIGRVFSPPVKTFAFSRRKKNKVELH